VALEAMARGIPLVVTETSPVTEILTHGETGWIVPCHPGAIADGILTLYRHAALRQKLACQALALFERDFTMAAYAQKIGKLLDELVQD
jgi:glycosyltransferase involved in cell wall biosynthesis